MNADLAEHLRNTPDNLYEELSNASPKDYPLVEKVYQVRVYYDDLNPASCFFEEDENGKWEFDSKEEALAVFLAFQKEEEDERVVLTETPKASEEECEELGIDYEIKEICVR